MHLVILHNDGFCLFRHVDAVNSTYHPFNEHGMIDIIPDIHGQLGKLESLLTHLGYTKGYRSWVHSERKVLFLGDYIDRGPQVRETLQLVRAMVEDGKALALMGNHELNAVAFHTNDDEGAPLRPHTAKNLAQHKATLESFAGREEELADHIEWFKGLPMFLELDGLRAVHSCWCEESIKALQGCTLKDEAFLLKANTKGTPEYHATERILKGPEIPLPPPLTFTDKDGHVRNELRVRWWGHEGKPHSIAEVAMPPGVSDSPDLIAPELFRTVPNYESTSIPVFFGHYWMQPDAQMKPLAPGICCLDFSAGRTGPLVAYRWDGEATLCESKFFTADKSSMQEPKKKEYEAIKPWSNTLTPEQIAKSKKMYEKAEAREIQVMEEIRKNNPLWTD